MFSSYKDVVLFCLGFGKFKILCQFLKTSHAYNVLSYEQSYIIDNMLMDWSLPEAEMNTITSGIIFDCAV